MNDGLRMTNDELRNDIRKLIAKIVKLPEDKVTFESDLFADLNVDSLVGMEIFAALDKKYGIVTPENHLQSVRTLGDLAEMVAGLVADEHRK